MAWFVTIHEPITGLHIVITVPEAFASGLDVERLVARVGAQAVLFAHGEL